MQEPSSENMIAPASIKSIIGDNSFPSLPIVVAAQTCTFTILSFALFLTYSRLILLSKAGRVFGIHTISVNPPLAAAKVPDSIVSLYSWPGSLK